MREGKRKIIQISPFPHLQPTASLHHSTKSTPMPIPYLRVVLQLVELLNRQQLNRCHTQ